ncbi:alpha/beta fold hydrolase [Gryllotalpicola protaetiae]|uniref:Alpha/beta fold hydrolase n=1 Tax=Gryllotalpicola protaetiae TaxID=2419771 RepID=A0A387BUP7_9MICO|nr:alpha/beta fold hydrolase [Gryllotalpicola protaetiae]AYG04607.1 alpha/beta fold hydrolase [Gryllotalpicola protaetiae]
MNEPAPQRHALIFGATGLIGRHVILALDEADVRVTAASRSDSSERRLRDWLADHDRGENVEHVRVDFASDRLLLDDATQWAGITEIYSCAGAYRFGMGIDEARAANVHSVERIVDFAATLPAIRRVVHVSGYRVGGQEPAIERWDAERIRRVYSTLGAYEASKVESDAVFRTRAARMGVPWSVVNPSTVIGDSRSGETDQQLGLAANLEDLWHGRLPALPGSDATFVPVVTADYLAAFMALLPADDSTARKSYWILDDQTPALPALLSGIARHYGTKAPRLRIPAAVIKRLPQAVTRTDPETLSFLSRDRYPTGTAIAVARRHDLTMPPTEHSIDVWADYLAAHRFGAAPEPDRRFVTVGGVRTFELGRAHASTIVLPGLPVNADTWAAVVRLLPDARALDLPGLGMSAGDGSWDWSRWLEALLATSDQTHMVAHSIASAAALEAAAAAPQKVRRLTLVAPFFLQGSPEPILRVQPVVRALLKRAKPADIARRLTGDEKNAAALQSSVADLRRPGTAARVAGLLARSSDPRWRGHLRELLRNYRGSVHIVVGADDPLTSEAIDDLAPLGHVTVSEIAHAGHHPQVTHPVKVADLISSFLPSNEFGLDQASAK